MNTTEELEDLREAMKDYANERYRESAPELTDDIVACVDMLPLNKLVPTVTSWLRD